MGDRRAAAAGASAMALGCALSLLLAGCGSSGVSTNDAADSTAAAPASPTGSLPLPAVSDDDRVITEGGGLSVPAETAGDLDSSHVPAPPDLGAGWRRFVDPGEAEDGYVGNGSWVRARGGAELAQAVVPLGCTGLTEMPRLPVPSHALEATYRGPGGAPAVALVLDFGRETPAVAFIEALGAVGRSCSAPTKNVRRGDPMVAVITQTRADATTILGHRREYGAGASEWVWSEVVVRRGSRVGLLTVASAAGAGPDLVSLSRSVRVSLAR